MASRYGFDRAIQKWSKRDYLCETLNQKGKEIVVTVTPNGLADAVITVDENGHIIDPKLYERGIPNVRDGSLDGRVSLKHKQVFCLPHETQMEIGDALDRISNCHSSDLNQSHTAKPSFYIQSQNNNLGASGDFAPLFNDIPSHVDFMSNALGIPLIPSMIPLFLL